MNVEKYTIEFDSLMIKKELREAKEQSIACYLDGLKYEISNVLYLQQYCSLHDVMKLALKVERQLKAKGVTTSRIRTKYGYVKGMGSMSFPTPKTTPKA